MAGKQVAIGIDLGTTFSSVGYWSNGSDGRVDILGNSQGAKITPSFVSFTKDEEFEVGEDAYFQAACNTTNTFFDTKRLIGREFSEEIVQNDIKLWPFKVVAGSDDKPMLRVTRNNGETKEFSPEQIYSKVLSELKKMAEAQMSSEVKDAVISVPANFNDSQRQATIHAAEIAGLNVLGLINEPTAAALCYMYDNPSKTVGKKNVLIFDLGGGKFDVSCLAISKEKIEVKAFGGDPHLGGEDFDTRVVNHFVSVVKTKHDKDISGNPRAMRRLRTACEKAKRSFSDGRTLQKTIKIDDFCEGVESFYERLSRTKFEELNMDLFNKCMVAVEKCLIDAKVDKNNVDEVVLVGGSSRIPKIQHMLRMVMNGKELYKSINVEEAIVTGATIQASILSGQNKKFPNLVLMDVTPLSLGIEIRGELMYLIAPKNTAIPTRVIKELYTAHDYQTSIKIPVYEGERARSRDNKLLGEMVLKGIKPDLRRASKIDVCFDLQPDGTLDVSARDRDTGRDINIVMNYARSSGEEVQRMIKEAGENRAGDEMYLKRGVARYALEIYISRVRDEMKTELVHMVEDEKSKVEDAVNEAVKWLDSRELAEVGEYEEEIKKLMDVMDVVRRVEIGN